MPHPNPKLAVLEQRPEASVIIPVHNGEQTLHHCLTAISASEGIGAFEVIVVDDGSTDSSAMIASNFPCRLIRFEPGQGPSVARNRGVEEAKGSRVVFVDSDVIVRPESLALLLRALDESPAAFATYDPEPLNKNFVTLLYHTLSCRSLEDTSEKTSVFYSYCAAISKDLFLELGGFDTSFTRATFEDVELGRQLARSGLHTNHLRSVRVFHGVRYDLPKLTRAYFRKSYDLAQLLLSHGSVTFGDQGWTSRKNWVALATAWGTLVFGPLALWVNPTWAVAWMLAVGGFLAASTQLYRSMARRHWIYGPLSVVAYLGIQCIATSAMVAVALRYVRNGLLSRAVIPAHRQVHQGRLNAEDSLGIKLDRSETGKARSLTVGELAIPFIIYFLLYTLTLSNVPSIATDSVRYINQIEGGKELFHPHHLLYKPFAWMWIALWRLVGIHIDGAILVSELNAIFGALTLCVFYSFLRARLACGRFTAILGTSLPAFSFAFWYYSGGVETYIIPGFFLWLALYALTADHVPAKAFLLVGFLNATAVLTAEMSVLFATVVLLAAWHSHRRGDCSLRRSLASYIVVAVPTVTIPYLSSILYVGRGSLHGSWHWLTLYAHRARFWNAPSASALMKAAIGLGQAFIGSHFLFALPRVRSVIGSILPEFYLTHNVYLVRNLKIGVAYLLVILSVCFCAAVVITFAASLAHWPQLSPRNRMLVDLLLVWLATYGAFVFFYTAVNAKLWIAQVLCIWMLLLVALLGRNRVSNSGVRWSNLALVCSVALLFFVNFVGSIRFTHEKTNDYYYFRVEPLLNVSHQGDLVIIGTEWKFAAYLRRYGKAQILSLTSVYDASGASPESLRSVQFAIDQRLAAGANVVVSSEAVEPEKETVQLYPGIGVFGTLWEAYRQHWCEREYPGGSVYVLEPAKTDLMNKANASLGPQGCTLRSGPDRLRPESGPDHPRQTIRVASKSLPVNCQFAIERVVDCQISPLSSKFGTGDEIRRVY